MLTLGIDTSNYTSSAAAYNGRDVIQRKLLLPVKPGEKGLRQSDAVFHHTVRLHPLVEEIFEELNGQRISALGVSSRPRDAEGSYMPCFCVGVSAARCVAAALGVPVYSFSHQSCHLAAALYSAGRLDLIKEKFIAFHISGGTTEMLFVTPDKDNIFSVKIIGETLDLNAGQAVDRAGLMLGLDFPCGAQLEKLALMSKKTFAPRVSVKNGSCSLSGLENKCRDMINGGENKEDTARFCLDFIIASLDKMTAFALKEYGDLPLLYAGGVMSNTIIRDYFQQKYGAFFAKPEFSCDNAAGVAVLAYERSRGL